MQIQYKIDILSELKKNGYSTYRLRKERILGEATIQKIRRGELVSWENIATICRLLECQPGDLIGYRKEETSLQEKEETDKILEICDKCVDALDKLIKSEN